MGARRQPQRHPDSAPQEALRPLGLPVVAHPDGVLRRVLSGGAAGGLDHAAGRLSSRHRHRPSRVRRGRGVVHPGSGRARVPAVPGRALRARVRPVLSRSRRQPVRDDAGTARVGAVAPQRRASLQLARRGRHADHRRDIHPQRRRTHRSTDRRDVARRARRVPHDGSRHDSRALPCDCRDLRRHGRDLLARASAGSGRRERVRPAPEATARHPSGPTLTSSAVSSRSFSTSARRWVWRAS